MPGFNFLLLSGPWSKPNHYFLFTKVAGFWAFCNLSIHTVSCQESSNKFCEMPLKQSCDADFPQIQSSSTWFMNAADQTGQSVVPSSNFALLSLSVSVPNHKIQIDSIYC